MISVCIAAHNGEKYIREQIDSILCQIGDEDEIIISDDGSTDNTLCILKSYNDLRIKVYNFCHTRKYKYKFDYATHNFENALLHANGDLIFLADQDDVWLPNKVSKVLANMNDCDILLHGRSVVDKNLNIIQEFAMPNPSFWQNIKSCTTTGCCTVFKREVLELVLPFPISGVAHDFWIGVCGAFFCKRKFLQEPLILFRRHDDNVTPSNSISTNPLSMKLRYRFIELWEIGKKLLKSFVVKFRLFN